MPSPVDRLDEFQRRHPVVGFPIAVFYKFMDDQGSYLAVVVTYYAFVAMFPLLLIASSVLGFILQGDPRLSDELLTSALRQFPIVGTELGKPKGLQGSASAVVFGSLAALYGTLGLGQAPQNAVNAVWAVPRNSRMNPILSRVSSLLLLVCGGLTVLAVTVLTSFASHVEVLGVNIDREVGALLTLGSVTLNALMLAGMMRLATTQRQTFRSSLPGALVVAVLWQLLQSLGGAYVHRVVSRASDLPGVFAIVLGLMALLYIASVMAIIGLEVNVVLVRRLYPRALLTPFTDAVELTEADRRAYVDYAKAQRHKSFQRVRVTFRRRSRRKDRQTR